MNDNLDNLYQEIILEAARRLSGKTDFSTIPEFDNERKKLSSNKKLSDNKNFSGKKTSDNETYIGSSQQFNPSCGDEVDLRVIIQNGVITDVLWEGDGCSISMASLSLMTDRVEGMEVNEAQHLSEVFDVLMHSKNTGIDEAQANELEDLMAFEGTSAFPMRIKCALLGWEALKDILDDYVRTHKNDS